MNRPRILIIEDNHHHRAMIKSILSPIKADVFETSTGEDSFWLLRHRPDLVIAKLKASPLDGSRICARIKANPSYMDIPVILMGTSESDENIKKGMAAGAFAYIDKSEAKANLIPAVEKLFNKSSEHPLLIMISSARTSPDGFMISEKSVSGTTCC